MFNCKIYLLMNIDRLFKTIAKKCLFVLQALIMVYYDLVAAKAIGTFESQPQKALWIRYTSFEITEHSSRLYLAGRTIMRVWSVGSGVWYHFLFNSVQRRWWIWSTSTPQTLAKTLGWWSAGSRVRNWSSSSSSTSKLASFSAAASFQSILELRIINNIDDGEAIRWGVLPFDVVWGRVGVCWAQWRRRRRFQEPVNYWKQKINSSHLSIEKGFFWEGK